MSSNCVPSLILLIPLSLLLHTISAHGTSVSVTEGTLHGKIHTTASGNSAKVFLGVPYARPPVKEWRFLRPEPPFAYNGGNRDATTRPPACVQFDIDNEQTTARNYKESEDCLVLNVYVPDGDVKAIIVWLHGGFYRFGSLNDYSDDGIIDSFTSRNVMFVSVQYRLGPLGFFNGGNHGLWDVIAAIDWVHRNKFAFLPPSISPRDDVPVSLMGESAGGMLASLVTASGRVSHMVSSVIIMSGSSLRPGALNTTMNRIASDKYAANLDCELPSVNQMLDCMRTRSVELLTRHFRPLVALADQGRPFPPVVDGELIRATEAPSSDEAVLLHILSKFQVPTLIGTTSRESAFRPCKEPKISYDDLSDRLAYRIGLNDGMQRRLVMHHYVHRKVDRADDEQLARSYAEVSYAGIWLYEFDYPHDPLHPVFAESLPQHCRAPFHAIDLAFAFRSAMQNSVMQNVNFMPDEHDLEVANAFVGSLCDFAAGGKPANASWSPVRPSTSMLNLPYMHFGGEGPIAKVAHKRSAAAL